MVCTVLREKQTLDVLSRYFKRSITIDNTYYRGDITTTAIKKRLQTPTGLVSVKFKSFDFELISAIAYGLDCSPTRTCAILLEVAVKNIKVVNEFIRSYMVEELTEGQMMELRKILTFVNEENSNNSSWLSILSAIVGDIRPATKKLVDLVQEFLKE